VQQIKRPLSNELHPSQTTEAYSKAGRTKVVYIFKRVFFPKVNLSFLRSPNFCRPRLLLNLYNGTNPCHMKQTDKDVYVLAHTVLQLTMLENNFEGSAFLFKEKNTALVLEGLNF
jgi:hypothetical protein